MLPGPKRGAIIAGSLVLLGIGALLARFRGSKNVATNPPPVPSSDPAAKRIPAVVERLVRLWPDATGDNSSVSPAMAEILAAHAWLESGVAEAGGGGWWTDKTSMGAGNMVGSGNLGARQCGKADGEGGAYFTCVEYGDSQPQPDGSQKLIPAKFRYYQDGTTPDGKWRSAADAAAWDFLRDVTRNWGALDELKSGDVAAYVKKLRKKGYYQGFGATEAEQVAGYGRALTSHLPAAAAALGHDRIEAIIDPAFLQGKAYVAPSKVAGNTGESSS